MVEAHNLGIARRPALFAGVFRRGDVMIFAVR